MNEPLEQRDFFVSFTGADRDWAAWIAWTIEEAGYSVWFQDWDFKGNFILEMDRAHTRSRRTIAVLSPAYLQSRFAAPEWAARFVQDAASEHDLLIPVRIADFEPEGLLAPIIYADLVGMAETAAKQRLLARLEGLRRKPTERPLFPGKPQHRAIEAKPAFPPTHALHNLPPRNPAFIGREAELNQLRDQLAQPAGQPVVLTQAITGLGGIGKTQTALAFAHTQLTTCRLVWWLDAEEPAKLAADHAAMAGPLGLPPQDDQQALVATIKAHLQASDGWLLIFDNAEDRNLIRPYLPTSGQGRVLITSRHTNWHGIARPLPLDVMNEPDALRLLTGEDSPEAALTENDLAEAKALAKDLGHLPLALAQARAFMHERGHGFTDYRKLLAERLLDVAARGADGLDPTIEPSPDPAAPRRQRAVTATWDISIEAADARVPGARDLLELLAFFAPEPLPHDILAADPEALPAPLRDDFARSDALAALTSFSLVEAIPGGITTHRLVQAITRESLKRRDPATAQAMATSAVALLLAARPAERPWDHRSWDHHQRLLPHHLAATAHAETLATALPEVATLLNETALYLKARASHRLAEPLYERALAIGEKTLGPDHPDLATRLNNLATLYRATGRLVEAEPLYKRDIAITEKALGPDHPALATSLNNLALLYQDTGRLAEAEPLFERAIAITEKALGPDHPDLARSLNNLASLYRATGRHAEAEPLYERDIAITEKALGPDHPALATSLNNLAGLCRATGRLADAEPLLERAIAITEKTLGPEHPDLAISLNNLAGLYEDTGRLAEAEPLYERAIAIIEASLPPDHPHQEQIRDNYAILLDAQGRCEEAATQRALAEAVRKARAAKGN